MQLNVRDPYFIYSANIVQNNVQARPLPVRPRTIYCSSIPSFDAEGCEGGALCRWGWGRALHSALHTTSPWPRLHCTLDTVYWSHQHSASAKRERESCLLCPVAPLFSLRWQKCGDGGGTWSGPGHPHLTHPSPSLTLTTCSLWITPASWHLLGWALDKLTSPGVPSALSAGPLVWWAMTRQGLRLSLLQNTQQKGERERPRPASVSAPAPAPGPWCLSTTGGGC